ncbi:MAG: helicase [Lysobacteraceae bacterium]|nr:MAG: helicase [Xanthomonadaceae bacterium]
MTDPLGDQGPFSQHIERFVPRIAQQQLAAAVTRALEQHRPLLAEAGTGTGKTFAYLVPVVLAGGKTLLSTGTRNLQDQLFARDLPTVLKTLGVTRRVALLKGRSNYLCLYRLGRAEQETPNPDLVQVRAWSESTKHGDLNEAGVLQDSSPLWPAVTSTADNCLGQECPMYSDCFVVKARRRAASADLIVINHHVLMADLSLKLGGFGELLPQVDTIVVDEAHQLPDTASRFLGRSVTRRRIMELVQDALNEAGEESGALATITDPAAELSGSVKRLQLAFYRQPERGDFAGALRTVGPAFDDAVAAARSLATVLDDMKERSAGLAACARRAASMVEDLDAFASGDESAVRWYERTDRGAFQLHSTPMDVAPAFQSLCEQLDAVWILTSATLSVAGDFSHFAGRLGFGEADTLSLPGPFDYQNNAMLFLPKSLPEPAAPDFLPRLVELLKRLLEASRGRAFILFTSFRALNYVADALVDQPWPLFVQGTDSRHRLLDGFRRSGNGVLLGAASFWEGVDVAGEALSLVVIDRLPFQQPDDPVLKARQNALRQAGDNPFFSFQLPHAVLRLKQGVGRLLRDIDDRGVLMIADPRIRTRRYGRLFIDSLPPMPVVDDLEQVRGFYAVEQGEDASTQ